MAICIVHKFKPQPESWDKFRPEHPKRVGMWSGWCNICEMQVAQYWNFGATLGATLYHITTKHRTL